MATVKYVELMRVYAMVIPFLILLMAGSWMVACRRVTPCVLSTTIIGLVTCTDSMFACAHAPRASVKPYWITPELAISRTQGRSTLTFHCLKDVRLEGLKFQPTVVSILFTDKRY